MSSSPMARSGGLALNGCRVLGPERTIRLCQWRSTPNMSAARSRTRSLIADSVTPASIRPRAATSSNRATAFSSAATSSAARRSSAIAPSVMSVRTCSLPVGGAVSSRLGPRPRDGTTAASLGGRQGEKARDDLVEPPGDDVRGEHRVGDPALQPQAQAADQPGRHRTVHVPRVHGDQRRRLGR